MLKSGFDFNFKLEVDCDLVVISINYEFFVF